MSFILATKVYLHSFLVFLCVSLPVWFFHSFILKNHTISNQVNWRFTLNEIYGFLLFASLLSLVILLLVHFKTPARTGFAFLITSSIKLFISVGLLYPFFRNPQLFSFEEKASWVISFFLILLAETFAISRFLNK